MWLLDPAHSSLKRSRGGPAGDVRIRGAVHRTDGPMLLVKKKNKKQKKSFPSLKNGGDSRR